MRLSKGILVRDEHILHYKLYQELLALPEYLPDMGTYKVCRQADSKKCALILLFAQHSTGDGSKFSLRDSEYIDACNKSHGSATRQQNRLDTFVKVPHRSRLI
uniref:Wsv206-like protein n=1 Tax=Trachysalambria curvirostris nimavirus TaxID=2984282 RepID=A0A9C7C6V6_9VIRU|nr:MAG: wsv206-like protein [Trachysalambria curvirostris nimavirus]